MDVLEKGVALHLFLEVIAFGRELHKVAPPHLQIECRYRSAEAMMRLQKLDEAEEVLHEGLAASPEESPWIPRVSRTIRGKSHALVTLGGLDPLMPDNPPFCLRTPRS
jgi:hypothetical protein